MKQAGMSIAGTALVVLAGLIVASSLGLVGITWPWERLPDALAEETIVEQPVEAKIVEIAPIALDCRARITASVPVEGRREHSMFGQVYRTDTVELTAVGDIDTCVDASGVEIVQLAGGGVQVMVPAEAVTFERPRVDATATRDSVEFDKGFVGKLTDVFPWVSENSGLTPAAYSFAQQVIGSSECMERAWSITEVVIRTAYQEQFAAAGGDRGDVSVVITGAPVFEEAPSGSLEGFDFEVGGGLVNCRVDGDAYAADPTDPPSERS